MLSRMAPTAARAEPPSKLWRNQADTSRGLFMQSLIKQRNVPGRAAASVRSSQSYKKNEQYTSASLGCS